MSIIAENPDRDNAEGAENRRNSEKFDYRNHLDKLKPDGGKNVKNGDHSFHCPACGSSNFKVNVKTGKYGSFGCDCANSESGKRQIRQALSPIKKKIRARAKTYYDYPDSTGAKLVRVTRIDDGQGRKNFYQEHWNGQKWVSGLGSLTYANIPNYTHGLVQEAIAKGRNIFITEGESKAEALRSLGLVATCNLGGSGKWMPHHSYNLRGAKVIICPDRDLPGIKHAEAIAADFPDARWLYAYPKSWVWKRLPPQGGLDVADWIQDEKLDSADIIAAIEPTARSHEQDQLAQPVELIERRSPERNTSELLLNEVDALLDRNLHGAALRAAVIEATSRLGIQAREINQLLEERIAERDRLADRDQILAAVERQTLARNAHLNVFNLLPEPLAQAITHLSSWLNLRPESYIYTLLATVSSLHKNGTELRLLNATNYDITPALYCGIVAPPSQRKTPIVKAVATKPLQRLHNTASEVYDAQIEDWMALCLSAKKDGQPEPKEPTRRLYHFTNTTGEAIMRQASRQPENGLLYLCDELKSLFSNANSYRSGKGSDMEDLLRYYDGDGGKVLRSEGLRDDVATFNFGIVGAIQPEVLRSLMGDGSDVNGQWSRFMFVNQPIAPNIIANDGGSVDMTALLENAYRRIDNLPPMRYRLTPAAQARWLQRRNEYETARCKESRPALSSYYGKSDGRIGKIAMNLHVLWWAMNGAPMTLPNENIDVGTIEAAIALTDFSIAQIESIYTDLEPTGDSSCPHITKIIEHLEQRGELKPRDVYAGFGRRFPYGHAKKSAAVTAWFHEIEDLGLGQVIVSETGSVTLRQLNEAGKNQILSSVSSLSSNAQNPYAAKAEHDDTPCHHPVITPAPVIAPKRIDDDKDVSDDSNDDSLVITNNVDIPSFQPIDDNDDKIPEIGIPVKPTFVKPTAGIKHDGEAMGWMIEKVSGVYYHLKLAGTSIRTKELVLNISNEHLVFEGV
jgi:hypothetical protein